MVTLIREHNESQSHSQLNRFYKLTSDTYQITQVSITLFHL